MKIVIDIDEEDYEYIKKSKDSNFNVIKNGTPLPKGHGRLIDADKLCEKCESKNFKTDTYNDFIRILNEIENAPTIIEGSESE